MSKQISFLKIKLSINYLNHMDNHLTVCKEMIDIE